MEKDFASSKVRYGLRHSTHDADVENVRVIHKKIGPKKLRSAFDPDRKSLPTHDKKGEKVDYGETTIEMYGAHGDIVIKSSNNKWRVQRTISLSEKSVEHDYFSIRDKNLQGLGIGKTMFRQWLSMYDKIGIKTLTVHAGLDEGWHTWAKYGFDFAHPHIHQQLVEGWKRNNVPDDIIIKYKGQPAYIIRNAHEFGDKNYGKSLFQWGGLQQSNWNGILDLTNKKQRAVLEGYIKYTKPKGSKRGKAKQKTTATRRRRR